MLACGFMAVALYKRRTTHAANDNNAPLSKVNAGELARGTTEELARANEELRRSNAELEQFAYIASHDLQEPLRMVTNYLQLLERRYGKNLDDDAREFIGFAVDGARRMKTLIIDLLQVSRAGTDTLNLRSISAEIVLQNAFANLKTAISESHAVITVDPLPEILIDSGLVTQVFKT